MNRELIKMPVNIDSYFDSYDYTFAIARLSSCLKACSQKKIWSERKNKCPSDLILFIEKTEGLIKCVFNILREKKFDTDAIIASYSDKLILDYCYANVHYPDEYSCWMYFPRHLSLKEFLNPYKAFQKIAMFGSKEEWIGILNGILHRALSPFGWEEYGESSDMLRIYLLLHKLLEASHLVHIRLKKAIEN